MAMKLQASVTGNTTKITERLMCLDRIPSAHRVCYTHPIDATTAGQSDKLAQVVQFGARGVLSADGHVIEAGTRFKHNARQLSRDPITRLPDRPQLGMRDRKCDMHGTQSAFMSALDVLRLRPAPARQSGWQVQCQQCAEVFALAVSHGWNTAFQFRDAEFAERARNRKFFVPRKDDARGLLPVA